MPTKQKKRREHRAKWTPFVYGNLTEEQLKIADADAVLVNSIYQVFIKRYEWPALLGDDGKPVELTHLSIKRRDRKPARDWRDFQRIKNEVCGREAEGVELYPAESRLVDAANQYHLWCLPEGIKFPLGFYERAVSEVEAEGSKQRPFPADDKPADLIGEEESARAREQYKAEQLKEEP